MIKQIQEELEALEKKHSSNEIVFNEYIKEKLRLFTKYAEYEEAFIEAIRKSPYCYATYLSKILNRVIEYDKMSLHCTDIECSLCCKRDIYDYLLRHINKLELV